ncbi:hypothetical protein BH11PLA2_BH11PLA2_40570 [soil metagenome]
MLKKFAVALGLAACSFLVVGCGDKASSVASAAKDAKDAKSMAKDAKDMAMDAKDKVAEGADKLKDEAMKMKDTVLSKFTTEMPKIEEAIGKLPADAQTKAKAALESVKKLYAEFKDAPMDKMKALGEQLTTAIADLKKQAGL